MIAVRVTFPLMPTLALFRNVGSPQPSTSATRGGFFFLYSCLAKAMAQDRDRSERPRRELRQPILVSGLSANLFKFVDIQRDKGLVIPSVEVAFPRSRHSSQARRDLEHHDSSLRRRNFVDLVEGHAMTRLNRDFFL